MDGIIRVTFIVMPFICYFKEADYERNLSAVISRLEEEGSVLTR